jgi:hypothetical protein
MKYPLWQNHYLQVMAETNPERFTESLRNHGPAFREGRKILLKGVDERHALSEFPAGLRDWLLSRTRGEYVH